MEAITREEKLMSAASSGKSSGIKPITREEMFLSYIAGESKTKPKPITRKEMFLDKIEKGEGGGTSGGGDIVPLLGGTIEEITIPNEVTNLAKGVFGGCTMLEEINADESHEVYKSVDGILYTKDGKKLVSYPPAKEETEYIMPDEVEEVENMAFNNSKTIEKVVLSDNIKSLPENLAIENKNAEIELVLKPDILAQGDVYPISSDMINTVTIPEGSTYLSATAFDNMPNIKNLYYNSECELETVGISDGKSNYFQHNQIALMSNLKKLVIGGSVKNISENFTYGRIKHASLDTLIIGDNVETIGANAFVFSKVNKELKISNNVKSIGDSAFIGAVYTDTLIIPDSVIEAGVSAFSNNKFTSVIIGKGLTELKREIFGDCYNLQEVVIPSNVKTICFYAFSYCENLTKVEMQEGVETLEREIFPWCYNLADVYIPRSVTSISEYAFLNHSNSNGIKIHGYAGSVAEAFVTEYGISYNLTFEVIEE